MYAPAMEQTQQKSSFFIIAHEPGAEHPAIPTWANKSDNPAQLDLDSPSMIERVDIETVPGAFQLTNICSREECQQLINITESLGYQPDAAVSLPRSIRHNDSFTWVVDQSTTNIIWQRCASLVNQNLRLSDNKPALGLNARFRFYRYGVGDYFSPHTDGSWPGSAVIDGDLVSNAFDDRWSQLTFLLFLSDDFAGGATQFFVDQDNPHLPASNQNLARIVSVKTPIGGVLCFPHGLHPMHCLHSSEPVTRGCKYIIRSDVLIQL